MSTQLGRALAALALLSFSGCTASRPAVVDDGLFACLSAEDCGPGQGCAEGNVYSPDFCRPACDLDDPSTCPDGVCTVTGACLESCTINADGTTSGCHGDEFTCVRTDALRDEGVCYPVEGCSRTADCATDGGSDPQLCLNDALSLPTTTLEEGYRFDNLYCTASPDAEERCPGGYLNYRFASSDGTATSVCFPPCELDGDGPFCPPATTCFRGFGELVGSEDTPCLPGVWGLPCEDDTQCLLGRCLVVGDDGRRACTETCADATADHGGCDGLERFSEVVGSAIRMTCETVRDQEVCVPRFDLLSLCDDQLDCVGTGTTCTEVLIGPTTTAHVCIRDCVDAQDCASGTGGLASEYRCVDLGGPSFTCMRKRPLGARCGDDLDCVEGSCCDLGDFSACVRVCR